MISSHATRSTESNDATRQQADNEAGNEKRARGERGARAAANVKIETVFFWLLELTPRGFGHPPDRPKGARQTGHPPPRSERGPGRGSPWEVVHSGLENPAFDAKSAGFSVTAIGNSPVKAGNRS